jgi:rubrerythrin
MTDSPCQMLKSAMRDEVQAQGFYDDLMQALIRANYPGEANVVKRIRRDEEGHARDYLEMARTVGCGIPDDLERQVMDL